MTEQKHPDQRFDIMGRRQLAFFLSSGLLLASLLLIIFRGLNLGLDFTGGVLLELGYPETAQLEEIRTTLAEKGHDRATVQYFGSSQDVLIRLPPVDGGQAEAGSTSQSKLAEEVHGILEASSGLSLQKRRAEFVGPQVGDELRDQGGLAVLAALAGIIIYVWLRFEKKFSVGAVAALAHDVILTLGVFALFQSSFDLSVLAAILAVIGYSLNDTIVVYDRIRENFLSLRQEPEQVMDISINQTLSRTFMTSITTLLVLLALFFVGGEVIRGFSLALIVGVLVGTYSSVFVASSLLLKMGVKREDLLPPEPEEGEPEMP